MTQQKIEPRVLKGFRDTLPDLALLRGELIRKLEQTFLSFGFAPIDTPALELSEILLGKGSMETDKQLFRFTDQGGRDVALRFDLTVPLARFVAQHSNELAFPFKRFHIAPVWRAEKPQKGRYREFIQCDFDIIGCQSLVADAEILCLTHAALNNLGISHCLRVNNRQILNGFLKSLGKGEAGTKVLRAIDKLDKLGKDLVREELQTEAGLSTGEVEQVFSFMALSSAENKKDYTAQQMLSNLRSFFTNNELALQGVNELAEVLTLFQASAESEKAIEIDLSIARGLEYYTGLVAETRFNDLPEIGSIASGGRYNDLASLYTKQYLPGVGFSIGLDRILAAYEELKRIPSRSSPSRVLISILDPGTEAKLFALATELRKAGINTEVYLEQSKLGNQIKYASKKQIDYVIIAGTKELAEESVSIKCLETGEQVTVKVEEVVGLLRQRLS